MFVLQRLLWNPDIAAQFKHAKVPNLYKDGNSRASVVLLSELKSLVCYCQRCRTTGFILKSKVIALTVYLVYKIQIPRLGFCILYDLIYLLNQEQNKCACVVYIFILAFSVLGHEEALSRFTLKKLLLLVCFLDKAKESRLIEHDPCLFCVDAEFKVGQDPPPHINNKH